MAIPRRCCGQQSHNQTLLSNSKWTPRRAPTRDAGLHPEGRGFDSLTAHQLLCYPRLRLSGPAGRDAVHQQRRCPKWRVCARSAPGAPSRRSGRRPSLSSGLNKLSLAAAPQGAALSFRATPARHELAAVSPCRPRRSTELSVDVLEPLFDDGWIEEVIRPVKSGKEATVYCCRAHPRSPIAERSSIAP